MPPAYQPVAAVVSKPVSVTMCGIGEAAVFPHPRWPLFAILRMLASWPVYWLEGVGPFEEERASAASLGE